MKYTSHILKVKEDKHSEKVYAQIKNVAKWLLARNHLFGEPIVEMGTVDDDFIKKRFTLIIGCD